MEPRKRNWLSLSICSAIAFGWLLAHVAAQQKFPRFRGQIIDGNVGDIWAIATGDINADGKSDVLSLSYNPDQVFWYENPTWKRRVIVEKSPKMPVSVQPIDVDNDGKTELILGAEYYEPLDTTKGGSIWLLKRPFNLDMPWTPILLDASPTLHRTHLIDLGGRGRTDIVCSSLLGHQEQGAPLFVLRRPRRPFKDKWIRDEISRDLHVIHNTWSVDWDGDGKEEVIAAAREGIILFKRLGPGRWERKQLGGGYQNRGSSEVTVGRLPGGGIYIAAVEPHHGHEAVVYTAPDQGNQMWKRTLLIKNRGGHTVWTADLTRTGVDTLLLGFVGHYGNEAVPEGPVIYLFHPMDTSGQNWEKMVLDDDPEFSGEDGMCSDLNGDGRIDVVLGGRAKVKIYWNEG